MPQALQDFMLFVFCFFTVAAFFKLNVFLGRHTPSDPMMFKAKFL